MKWQLEVLDWKQKIFLKRDLCFCCCFAVHNDVTDIFARKLSHVPNIIHSALQNLKLTNAF